MLADPPGAAVAPADIPLVKSRPWLWEVRLIGILLLFISTGFASRLGITEFINVPSLIKEWKQAVATAGFFAVGIGLLFRCNWGWWLWISFLILLGLVCSIVLGYFTFIKPLLELQLTQLALLAFIVPMTCYAFSRRVRSGFDIKSHGRRICLMVVVIQALTLWTYFASDALFNLAYPHIIGESAHDDRWETTVPQVFGDEGEPVIPQE